MLIRSGKGPFPALFLAIDTHNQVLHHYATILLSNLDSHRPSTASYIHQKTDEAQEFTADLEDAPIHIS